ADVVGVAEEVDRPAGLVPLRARRTVGFRIRLCECCVLRTGRARAQEHCRCCDTCSTLHPAPPVTTTTHPDCIERTEDRAGLYDTQAVRSPGSSAPLHACFPAPARARSHPEVPPPSPGPR